MSIVGHHQLLMRQSDTPDPPGPPEPPYNLYRLRILALGGSGTFCSISELQFYDSQGGSILTNYIHADNNPPAATASAFAPGFEPKFAFQTPGPDTTTWLARPSDGWSLPGFIQYDFGMYGTGVTVGYYAIRASQTPNRTPSAWDLQVSNGGQNWHTVDSRSGELFTFQQTKGYLVT